jgi:excisionase family DNA binding protein
VTERRLEAPAALDVERAAARVGVSVDTIRRAYRSGRLRAYRPVGQRRVVIRVEDLEAWAFGDEQLVAPQQDASRLRPIGDGGLTPRRPVGVRSRAVLQPGSVERLLEIERRA